MSSGLPIDLHAHVLAGLDDGPETLDDAIALCRALVDEGVETVAASPHVKPNWPTTPGARDAALQELRNALAENSIDLKVLAGGELDIRFANTWSDDDLAPFAIEGTNLLIVEVPFGQWDDIVTETATDLIARGWRVTLAHPERNIGVQLDYTVLDPVREAGATCHATTEAFTGDIGVRVKGAAFGLVRSGRIDAVATDAHDTTRRPSAIPKARQACIDAGFDDATMQMLFETGPATILAG
jgi:protein-tyrosine phosphatase